MATYNYIGYSTSDIIDLNGGTLAAGDQFRLSTSWDASLAIQFSIKDNDANWQGDTTTDESSDDKSQQTLDVYSSGGALLASGDGYLEERYTFTDEFGNTVNLYSVEINGTLVGYIADGALQPGNTYTLTSITDVTDADAPTYTGLTSPTYDPDLANTVTGTSLGDSLATGAASDTVSAGDGADTIDGGSGADSLSGDGGADTITGGAGADTIAGGTGDDSIALGNDGETDTVVFTAGDGNDTISGFEAPIDNGDGTFTGQDQLALSGLLDLNGFEVRSDDVSVSDDGSGNAVITFPSGETLTLIGVATGDISAPEALEAMGFLEGADHTVQGTSGDDLIDAAYGGDPQGDLIDFGDAPDGSDDDVVLAFGGDDTVQAGAGADSIEGGLGNDSLEGGTGDDTIWGDSTTPATGTPATENLSWAAQGAAGTDLTGGFTQVTGDMEVSVSWTNDGNATGFTVDTTAQYVDTGEPMSTTSAGLLQGTGLGATSTTTLDFAAAAGTGLSDEVQNVQFRINDIDTGAWQDVITVRAYDANGNPVSVTLSTTGDDTITGDTITAGPAGDAASSANGSVLVEIAGPVQSVEIVYSNADTGGQALWITDVYFDSAFATDVNDYIDGGDGADLLYGQTGDDTILGGAGADTAQGGDGADSIDGGADDDSLLGDAGSDTIRGGDGADIIDGGTDGDLIDGDAGADTLYDGAGTDTVYGGTGSDLFHLGTGNDSVFGEDDADRFLVFDDSGTDTIDGGEATSTGADQDVLDFSNLTGPVTVSYSGNEAGSYAASGPSGQFSAIEEQQLTAFDDSLDGALSGAAMTVDGGAGADTLTGGSAADSILGGLGDDVITGGAGADVLDGGADADTFLFEAGFGNDTITGGESGTDADTLDFSGSATGVGVTYDGFESGTVSDGAGTLSFSQIEAQTLTGQADTVDGTLASSALDIDAGAGDDSVLGGTGDDTLLGGTGADTLGGGEGADSLSGGAGDDLFLLTDDMGADTIADFDIGDTDGDGIYNDQLDVSGLFAPDGNEIRSYDITTEDDGFGNVRLVFPNGETLVLQGVTPAQMSSSAQLNAAGIPCFTPGTLIATTRGEVPVEKVVPGDLVITRDNGPKKVLWAARRTLGPQELHAAPWLKPVLLSGAFFGVESDLLVSPQHGVLLAPRSDRSDQRLVRAVHLAQIDGGAARVKAGSRSVTYIHLLFEEHQVIFSNGIASESFYPGENVLAGLAAPELNELAAIFPNIMQGPVQAGYAPPARDYSKRHWLPETAREFTPI